jgi:hypothetical protein
MLSSFFLVVVAESGDGMRPEQPRKNEGQKCCCDSLAMEHVSGSLETSKPSPT